MKLLFMGTPEIAAQCLQALLAQPQHTVCGVFTREDKPVGRRQVLTAPPVKQVALAHGIPVFQPRTLKEEAVVQQIAALAPDLIAVVAYGRILPQAVLDIPPLGAVNLHVSLLPKYRGAAPVQWSVLNGDTQTGVTVMRMDAGLDTGDILCTQRVPIGPNTTSGELFEQVTQIGAQLLCTAVDALAEGTLTPTPQDDAQATWAPPLTKEMARFDFSGDAQTLHNLVRGLNPWPVAHFVHEGKKIKVLRTVLAQGQSGAPGEILSLKPLTVACANGALTLLEVVPEGSRPMEGSAWAAGRRFRAGDCICADGQ